MEKIFKNTDSCYIYYSIMGNIGAGKTTLASELATILGLKLYKEKIKNNKYLDKFYADMKKYAFETELYLLRKRWKQQKDIVESLKSKGVIQDRTIYEDLVFYMTLKESGMLTDDQYNTCIKYFINIIKLIYKPNVIIYLKVSPDVLLERIKKRGRENEKGVNKEYLMKLEKYYNDIYINISKTIPVIVVNWNKDSKDITADAEKIAQLIKAEINKGFYREIVYN